MSTHTHTLTNRKTLAHTQLEERVELRGQRGTGHIPEEVEEDDGEEEQPQG